MASSTIINDRKISDVNLSFIPDPNTGDLTKVTSFAAIRRSLKGLLLTRILDKPFREDLGSPLGDFLFDVTGVRDIPIVETLIANTIQRFEPRVGIKRLEVIPDLNNNRLEVVIEYVIKATRRTDSITTFLSLSE